MTRIAKMLHWGRFAPTASNVPQSRIPQYDCAMSPSLENVVVSPKGVNLEPNLTFSRREGLTSSPDQTNPMQSPTAQPKKTSLLRQPDCLSDNLV